MRLRLAVLLVGVALVAVVAGAAASTPGESVAGPTPVVVDTDLGPDDVLALLYLLRRPEVDLRGVTVSGTGLVHCPVGARNVLALLAAAGRTDVPVACGPGDPVAGFNAFPPGWRVAADGLFGLRLARASRRPDPAGAVALLRSLARAEGTPTTLLQLGPATTVASALRAEPALARRLARVVVMGGAFGVPGNIGAGHERAEYNVWVDPVAMQTVLRSGVPVTFVPLDATNRVPATVLVSRALAPLRHATREAMLAFETMTWSGLVGGGQYFWDPLAAVAVAAPALVRSASATVRVVTASGADQGRVVRSEGGTAARIVTGVDRAAFERQLLSSLVGSAVAAPARTSDVTIRADGSRCTLSGRTRLAMPARPDDDEPVLTTVNTSSRRLVHAVGILRDGKTLADLRAAARALPPSGEPPSWFEAMHTGETPPHSEMSWPLGLPPGRFAVGCVLLPRTQAWVAGAIDVAGG